MALPAAEECLWWAIAGGWKPAAESAHMTQGGQALGVAITSGGTIFLTSLDDCLERATKSPSRDCVLYNWVAVSSYHDMDGRAWDRATHVQHRGQWHCWLEHASAMAFPIAADGGLEAMAVLQPSSGMHVKLS